MRASCEPRRAPPRRPESRFSSWCFVGVLLVALELRLPTPTGGCGAPPDFQSMKFKGTPKPLYRPGEYIYYECKPGHFNPYYIMPNTFCEQNNSWHPLRESCYKRQCKTPVIPNGEVYRQFEIEQLIFQFDDEAYFYCNYGYYLKGKQSIICKLDGDKANWEHDIPTCEKILCGEPGNIDNGKHTNSWRDVFEFNEVVTYSCDPSDGPLEYSLVGESQLFCAGPDQWSSDPPQCKVVECEQPVLEYGKPLSKMKEKFSYKDVVSFECLTGFYLNGSNQLFCGGDSTWEPEMPTCVKGFKPTHPTKPPLSNYPGYPHPREFLIEKFVKLDTGAIAAIIITILLAIAVILTCIYKCLCKGDKG